MTSRLAPLRSAATLLPFALLAPLPACALDVTGNSSGSSFVRGDGGARVDGAVGDGSSSFGDDDDDGVIHPTGDGGATDDAGSPPVDAGDGTCDLSGTWGTSIDVPVDWHPQGVTGVILAPGSGHIRQWIKAARTVQITPQGVSLLDTTVVCGVALPDFDGTAFAGGEHYGVRFPDSLFDSGELSSFALPATLSSRLTGGDYQSSSPTAVLLGLTMASATSDPWPSMIADPSDDDRDGKPGVTLLLAQGSGYSDLPVDKTLGVRTDRLYVAIRQLNTAVGKLETCDRLSGTVDIPLVDSKPAIDSHVIGCGIAGSTADCSPLAVGFLDSTEPIFTPTGKATFNTIRMPPGATCAQVRAAFPATP